MSDLSKFYLCLGGLCFLYPPLLGLVISVGFYVVLWYLIYKFLFGGRN